ncbi:hypothetical protein [Desulfovibrio sp. SGI.169]|uniref:hypothetical protein n=1 Tax=Desulfovibrio sp. SGI.169 TaxID=3420561 RepID=UPI003D056E38
MNTLLNKMDKFIDDERMKKDNIFSIDFYLGEDSNTYNKFDDELRKHCNNVYNTKISSNRILKSKLDIDELRNILIKWKISHENFRCIITDYTNRKIRFINIDDDVESLLMNVFH